MPEEQAAQERLRQELLIDLQGMPALADWIRSLPATGRVAVMNPDARWLITHPNRDPVLAAGHTVVVPPRPRTVTVVTPQGERCAVAHAPGREAIAYVDACEPRISPHGASDWAWIAQPDGRVERYGIVAWNRVAQDEPAPGAWIWAPARGERVPERTSERLIRFLATQGPAADPAAFARAPPPSAMSRGNALTANDWGEVGLLQTPSARIAPSGTLSAQLGHVWPYTRGNVFMTPFDWLEAGFRYTDIANRAYLGSGGGQTGKDKSFDAKFRLWRESAYVPEIAVGFRDIVGTGLFSSEYLVGSKRYGSFDLSLGAGWGYMAGKTRVVDVGQGGTFDFNRYFHGGAELFGGVQYQTPWQPLILKLEREANNYQHEPLDNGQPQSTHVNFGVTYRLARGVDLSAGVERGNRLMIGIAFTSKVDELYTPKLSDPPRVAYVPRAPKTPDWSATSAELERQTGWRVGTIDQAGRELRVTLLEPEAVYWRDGVERAAAVLNRDAPPEIDRFRLVLRRGGLDLAEHVVDRDAWAAEQTRPVLAHERLESVMARPPEPPAGATNVFTQPRQRLEHALGFDFFYNLGGADAFLLYQFSLAERARLWINDTTWIRAKVRLGLIDNYDRYQTKGISELPHVRTDLREYLTTSKLQMPQLQATHTGKLGAALGREQFWSVYAGYMEEMFGGVGAEWLYRPFGGKNAFGVDMNYVRKRDFDQHFGFQDYSVKTGHATLYYDTGWNDVLATISAGQYLAGDRGATFQLARVFQNGVTVGGFFTKTNVSAEQFGEGSFDKGVFLYIPFDAMLTRTIGATAHILYRPLLRDGGAKLVRPDTLYGITSVRDSRTLWYRPAAPSSEFSLLPP